jgi:hypothetical protein
MGSEEELNRSGKRWTGKLGAVEYEWMRSGVTVMIVMIAIQKYCLTNLAHEPEGGCRPFIAKMPKIFKSRYDFERN